MNISLFAKNQHGRQNVHVVSELRDNVQVIPMDGPNRRILQYINKISIVYNAFYVLFLIWNFHFIFFFLITLCCGVLLLSEEDIVVIYICFEFNVAFTLYIGELHIFASFEVYLVFIVN